MFTVKYLSKNLNIINYMSLAGSVEGLARSAEMTVQPGIT